jgi:putative membrane protein
MGAQTKKQIVYNEPIQSMRNRWFKPLLYFLIALHFFGLLGMHWGFMNAQLQAFTPFESFISLTPLNLILTTGMLLFFHEDWQPAFVLFAVLAILTGFFAEVAGVATGLIFGEYSYGATLGWKLWEVPLVIGLNWFLLSYVCCSILRFENKLIRTLAGAALMVLLDLIIEPVAIHYDFWSWALVEVPLQNYLAWFVIALIPCGLFCYLPFKKNNRFAKYVFWAQLLFFAINNLLI